MDIAVKERLIGAAVLVAIVVLVVPALLRGPRPPAEPAPTAAGDVRVVEIDLAGSGATKEEPLPGPSDLTEPEPVPSATGVPVSGGEPAPGDAAQAGMGSPEAVEGPRQGPTEAETAAAAPAAPAAASPPGSGWAVQLAALSKQETAAQMVAELRQKGYPAFVLEHRADGRVLYRVRVGPEAQRERAEVLARRLQDDGFKPAVVEQP